MHIIPRGYKIDDQDGVYAALVRHAWLSPGSRSAHRHGRQTRSANLAQCTHNV
ncbi:MAG: hypothetical protein HC804_07370, partial [Anaerolineae bacterium]|nr:hypothetical protein [Anaerolineae bacterium]